MKKTYELLEKAILDSFIINPDLMKNSKVEEKHFKNHKRLFSFINQCYKRFGTLDIRLMASVCPNASDMIDYIADILDGDSTYVRFNEYQEQLLSLYNDFELIENIYNLSKKLYIRDIKIDEFKKEIRKLLGDE